MRRLMAWVLTVIVIQQTAVLGQQKGSAANGNLPPFVVRESVPEPEPCTHLSPVGAYDPSGYTYAVYRALIGKRHVVLSMVTASTLNIPEDAVLIYEEPLAEPKRWLLEHSTAKERVDNSIIRLKDGDLDRGIQAERIILEIPQHFAGKMIQAWQVVLDEVRAEQSRFSSADGGTGVIFQCYNAFGSAGFPGTVGVPVLLRELGGNLRALTLVDTTKRDSVMRECLELADKIIQSTKTKSP